MTNQDQKQVVLLVGAKIDHDARVINTARSILQWGYKVTILYADWAATEPVEGSIDAVQTLAVPVPYVLLKNHHARVAALARPSWLSRLGLAYRNSAAFELAESRLALRRVRAPLDGRSALTWHRVLHHVRYVLWRRIRPRVEQVTHRRRSTWDWRTELANVADLEAAFVEPLRGLNPDVIHVHDLALLWGAANAKKALTVPQKPVVLIYDARAYLADSSGHNQYQRAAYRQMELAGLRHVDAVTTTSQAMADQLVRDWRREDPPAVIMNLPRQTGLVVDQGPHLRADLGLAPDVPLLVYSGWVKADRHLTALVSAIKPLPRVHLAVICLPSAQYKLARRLQAHCAKVGLIDRVHLVDPVPLDAVVSYLASADLGLFAPAQGANSYELALPGAVMDYLMAGLPVAVSELATLGQFVQEHELGQCFCPTAHQTITAAIENVLGNLPEHRSAVKRLTAQDWFSWEAQAVKLRAVYAKSVAQSIGSASSGGTGHN